MVRISQKQDVENQQTQVVEVQQQSRTSRCSPIRVVGSIVFSLISLCLLAYFVATIFYNGDRWFYVSDWPTGPPIIWLLFKVFNAAVPAMFLAYYWVCFPTGVFSFVMMAINIWSIVYLVMTWITNNDTQYERSTMTLVYFSMASSVYHSLLARYWVTKYNPNTA